MSSLRAVDGKVIDWMRRHGVPMLQIALAVIFVWFGALKTFGASPADDIVRRTVYWFSPDVFVPLLGIWEMVIGVCLLFRPLLRVGLLLLFLQLPGTFLPLIVLPKVCFTQFPFGLTMEGQYIVKNLLIIGAALVVGGSMHALKMRPEPTVSGRPPRGGA
nr:hypothetical protein [Nibricoccus aquaticus]